MRNRAARIVSAFLAVAAMGAALPDTFAGTAVAQDARPVRLTVDRAKVVRIPRPADTVIIGNPGVVGAVLQDATTIVLTGRAAGETNIIILDDAGDPIVDETVVVGQASHATVRVYMGTVRQSYACAPYCTRSVDAGDEPANVKVTAGNIATKNTFAKGDSDD